MHRMNPVSNWSVGDRPGRRHALPSARFAGSLDRRRRRHLARRGYRPQHGGVQRDQHHLLSVHPRRAQPDRVAGIGGRVSFATFATSAITRSRSKAWRLATEQVDIHVRGVRCEASCRRSQKAIRRDGHPSGPRPVLRCGAQAGAAADASVVLDTRSGRRRWRATPRRSATRSSSAACAPPSGIAPLTFHGIGPERPAPRISMGMVPMGDRPLPVGGPSGKRLAHRRTV